MITEERLQEIKKELRRLSNQWKPLKDENFLLAKGIHEAIGYSNELIAAVEQAQAELTDLQLRYDNQREDCIDYVKDIADLREQLAASRAEVERLRNANDCRKTVLGAVQVELAEAQAEVERLMSTTPTHSENVSK